MGLVAAVEDWWWNIAEGLMAMAALVVAVMVLGRGLLMEWLPLPRAAGTSWLCFPS